MGQSAEQSRDDFKDVQGKEEILRGAFFEVFSVIIKKKSVFCYNGLKGRDVKC